MGGFSIHFVEIVREFDLIKIHGGVYMPNVDRGKIFYEELDQLYRNQLIDISTYTRLKQAYGDFENRFTSQAEVHITPESLAIAPEIQEELPSPVVMKPEKPVKPKKVLSKEEIRERNITWTLILGVIMLLISGLVVATSNWAVMSDIIKVSSIGLVAVLFYIISLFSQRILKIEKTAFAFLTLANLFVPIVFLSAGFYEIFGRWFSIYGTGSSFFGLLSGLISLSIYAVQAYKMKNRLFIWFSLITSSITVGFLLSALQLKEDAFYLGIMLYNSLLIYLYYRFKNDEKRAYLIRELPIYSQLNLILSSILMLIFFNQALFYSFNVILTSILYISMVYVYKQRNYHFVFSAMIVYGLYQFIENSFLQSANLLLYSFFGFIFLALQSQFKSDAFLQKMFRYTSAVISGAAFIFISLQAILMNAFESSVLLFFAYLVIAANFFFLAYQTKHTLFTYLAPIFVIVAGFESWQLLDYYFGFSYVEYYMFAVTTLVYMLFYLLNNNRYLLVIKRSSLIVTAGVMFVIVLISFQENEYFTFSVLAFALALVAYMTFHLSKNQDIQKLAQWLAPSSFAMSLIFWFDTFSQFRFYETELNLPTHLAIVGLVMIGISFFMRNIHLPSFIIGQSVYSIALLALFDYEVNEAYVLPLLFLGGVFMYSLLARKTKLDRLYILVSIMSLFFYYALYDLLGILGDFEFAVFITLAPIFLSVIKETIGRKVQTIVPYYQFTAQVIMALTLVILYLFSYITPVVIAIGYYLYVIYTSNSEWSTRLSTYLGATSLLILVNHVVDAYYSYFITGVLLFVIWLLSSKVWKQRLDYYLIPLHLLSAWFIIVTQGSLIFTAISIFLTLYLLHRRNWDLLNFLPLSLSILVWFSIGYENHYLVLIAQVLIFMLLKQFGEYYYKRLYVLDELKTKFDWYSITALGYIILMYQVIDPTVLWQDMIPPVLLVFLLYTQIKRFDEPMVKKGLISATALLAYYPYLVLLSHFTIPDLIVTELTILPLIILAVVLSKTTWTQYTKTMINVQSAVLLFVAIILFFDAYWSNTIWDVVVLGSLAIISIGYGFQNRVKSYFLIGTGVLLLSILVQTKPYWGNMPWWVYLLISGIALITIASTHEWRKQQREKGKTQKAKKGWIQRLKEWD